MRAGMASSSYTARAVWLLTFAAACTGRMTPPGDGPESPQQGGERPDPLDEPASLPPPRDLGPAALRRLSNAEYANTVEDLLQTKVRVTDTFLPDDRTLGYDNIAEALTVTPVLAEQYGQAAKTLAGAVDVDALAPCKAGSDESTCADAFIRSFGRRAYRRPLGDDELAAFRRLFEAERTRVDYRAGITVIVETMLHSPHFLYKTELGQSVRPVRELTAHEVATHLSYLVTGSMPDAELAAAADAGSLRTPEQREAQVRRLLGTPRASSWLRSFVTHWLGIADVASAQKDPTAFPDYAGVLRPAIAEGAERFVDAIFNEAGGSLRTLFVADWSYANGPLGKVFGLSRSSDAWQKVALPADKRLGILTHPAFLAAHSKADDSFPITRGKILRTRVMCRDMPPPPPDVVLNPVKPNPSLTTRERFEMHARSGSVCASCHTLIDPLGFGFENYDAIGQYRAEENGKAIDSTGKIVGIDAEVDGPFANAVDFVKRVGPSQVLSSCVAREALRWGLGRVDDGPMAGDPRDAAIVEVMSTRLASRNTDLRELLVALVRTQAYGLRSER